ncbi:hypothetical protein RCL_jg27890.t1 [Rhizophagus clarus]|uniref:ARS-binding protein 1 N-terminal domain-containing protein n=1 Tax=Rhizophagus clarus TaxID=94130 RepID=A0A8H3LYZ0_9GLOM|nr:hypothetical protein RCL_jg27890.t1 [Rhizophagus clarus]
MSFKITTLTETQKQELCIYARDNSNRIQTQYISWIEEKWGVTVNKSTIIRILQTAKERLNSKIISSNKKRTVMKSTIKNFEEEASSADEVTIAYALPLLRE